MNIYQHTQAHILLREAYEIKRQKNPAFSIRSWAVGLGMKSHGSLQQILAGKRQVPKKYLPRIVKSLDFSQSEALYFETLVDFERAKTTDEREIYYSRLKQLRPGRRDLHILEIEHHKYFKNPLHLIIPTLVERSDFQNSIEWIRENLRIKTTRSEIKETIDRLIRLGILTEEGGTLKNKAINICNKTDLPVDAVQEFHQKMSQEAANQIKLQSTKEKEYNSFCFNIKRDRFLSAQKTIREFIDKFLAEYEAPEKNGDSTYHLNVQLFSLTKKVQL